MKKLIAISILILSLGLLFLWPNGRALVDRRVTTRQNYGDQVCSLSQEYEIPYNYLMALITQECSGKNPCPSRYEKHVFRRLQQVRDGKKKQMDRNVTHDSISDANDDALKNLATSWGPFQLMGYQSIGMKTTVSQIRGPDSLKYGIQWIKEDYGHLLGKKRYKDSFHWHNAGRVYPQKGKTESAEYVSDALEYMEFFKDDCNG
jgi:hypothetical protein